MMTNIIMTLVVVLPCFGGIILVFGLMLDVEVIIGIGRFCIFTFIVISLLLLGITEIWDIWKVNG